MSYRNSRLMFAALAGLGGFVVSCGGPTQPPGPSPAAVATVDVSPATSNLASQQTVQLTAVLRDAAGGQLNGRAITWSASPSQNATVSTTGLVTAVAPGAVTITATSEGKAGSAQVTVAGPVATVVLSATTSILIPQQTLQLAVALKDAAGTPLTGRSVGWTSSQTQVASVSGTGVVTALVVGSTTITATSEGKTGIIVMTVSPGAVVGPNGGTVTAGNGTVEVTVPAGAVSAATPISLTLVAAPTTAAPAKVQFNGPVYQLGPAGVTFAQPVTIKLKYDLATMPRWAMTGDLAVFGSNGTQWSALTNTVVDLNAGTISGKTSSFGAAPAALRALGSAAVADQPGPQVSAGVSYATVTLTPATGSVNFQQRAVSFHAHLVPLGAGIPIPVPGATTPTPQWKYRWRTTGQNGVLGSGGTVSNWSTKADEQYVATNPQLNLLSGPIDVVYVDVLLNPSEESNPAAQKITTREVTVDADLKTTYEVSPRDKTIDPGQTQNFQLVIRDKEGNILQPFPNSEITWLSSGNHGALGGAANNPVTTYTAKSTFSSPPPRVDDIKVTIVGKTTVTNREVQWDFSSGLPKLQVISTTTETRELKGEAKGFVTVKVNYQVKLEPVNKTISVGGTQLLVVTLDPAYDGPGLEYKYTNSAGHGTLNVTSGARTSNKQVTYSAKALDAGGTDQLEVEVVSVAAGVELESVGKGQASIVVDPFRTGFIGPNQRINQFGSFFTAAQIRVNKVPGATKYEISATTPDGPYSKTFGGATSTDPYTVGQVLDGGTYWYINIEAGFNTIESAADARYNLYFTKYKNTVIKYKAT